jgi:quinol monooxygenase YgiN
MDAFTSRDGARIAYERGRYRIIEVWDTREAADAFYQSKVLREATAGLTTETRITMTWQVYGLDNGSGSHATR